jgi:hypothetical protein
MSASDADNEQQPRPSKPEIDNSNMELPAIFWDSMPENAEEHPDFAAFKAIEDECTPEERAGSMKVPMALLHLLLHAGAPPHPASRCRAAAWPRQPAAASQGGRSQHPCKRGLMPSAPAPADTITPLPPACRTTATRSCRWV